MNGMAFLKKKQLSRAKELIARRMSFYSTKEESSFLLRLRITLSHSETNPGK
jgi:hypothetical protein